MSGYEDVTTGEALLQPDIADYRAWVEPLPDGGALLVDPLTHERIDPYCPPELLSQDARLGRGYRYLQFRRTPLQATVLYGAHQEYEHLDESQGPGFEARVSKSDAYFYEYRGWNHEMVASELANARGAGMTNSGFLRRVFSAISGAEGLALPADVEDTDRPLEETLLKLQASRPEIPGDPEQFAQWWTAWTNLREWYMVGRIGYELSLRDPQGWSKVFQAVVSPPSLGSSLITVGSAHRDLTRKLTAMGVTVNEVLLDSHELLPPAYVELTQAVATGVIPDAKTLFATR